tara:strand:+ start:9269 stop:10516 length:1248 start_codon:yes stop_codon:yes gene_type:complete
MIILHVVIFIVLLILSAFFSGAESAFFSLKKSSAAKLEKKQVMDLLSNPRRLLITILTGNTVVNTVLAFLTATLTADIALKLGANITLLVTIEAVVLAIVILLVSEITPKILAIRNSEIFAERVALPIRMIGILLYPIAAVLYNITHALTRWLPFKREELFDSEEELRTLADIGADQGTLDEAEKEMIQSVFDFGETSVREIMVPRIDISGMEQTSSINNAIKIIRNSRYSKFPVYEEDLDSIKGILYAKDVLPFLNGQTKDTSVLEISREPYFVPESKPISDLLKDFQNRRENIAIVVDEFGGTAGLVTVEDIVEEVVGEIKDEFDRESPLIVPIKKNEEWLVDAKIPINDLEEVIAIPFPEEREYDTLGGFIFDRIGDIPSVGEKTTFSSYEFKIHSRDGNRIVKVTIKRSEK